MSTKTITLVQAPQVPNSERELLEKRFKESVINPEYILIANYEVRIDVIKKKRTEKVFITAPNIPSSEVHALRQKVEEALAAKKPEDRVIVVNYECLIFTLPQNGGSVKVYGQLNDPDPEETKEGHEETEILINGTFSELTRPNDLTP
jgi:hypothetical protein